MKALFISSEFPPGPGGIGTHAYQLALRLHARSWETRVLTPQDFASAHEAEAFNRRQPFPIHPFPRLPLAPLKAAQRYAAFRRSLREFRPDLVVATGKRAVWIAAAALRKTSIPWVAIAHGTEFGVTGWERNLVIRAFNSATAVVPVSEFTARVVLQCGVRPRLTRVLPNGADGSVFHRLPAQALQDFRRSMGYENDRLLLTVGNVTERKGQEVVIRAMPRILQQCPNARYLMAGLPSERVKLEGIARDLGVAERVHFLGRVEEDRLLQLMNAADLFLMTSRITKSGDCEGFGIAAIEAALCGKAAVVSAGSGLAEAVVHEQTALCVPEGDSSAVAHAVVSLLLDDERRLRLAANAESRARREQTWERRAGDYEEFFLTLIEGSGAAGTSPGVKQGAYTACDS